MILYSVSVSVSKQAEAEWLAYMRDQHIDDVLATGYFSSAKLNKELSDVSEMANYRIDYVAESVEKFEEYQTKAAPALQQDHTEKFKGHFTASRAVYEVIAEKMKAI